MIKVFQDECDADLEGNKWLNDFAIKNGADLIEMMNGQGSCGAMSAWKGRKLLGYYLILRDGLNWSVLIKHDLVNMQKH
jgi:hypothetical protein